MAKEMNKQQIPAMFEEYGDIVSIQDVMKMLGVGRSAVYSMLQEGTLRSVRIGRKYIIPKQSVIDVLFP